MTSLPPPPIEASPHDSVRDRDRVGRRAVRGFLTMGAGNAGRAVLKVALLAILGRLLSPADFGRVEAAGIIVWLSLIFAGLGVGAAIVQRERLEPRHISTATTSSIVLGTALGALIYTVAPWISTLLRVSELAPLLRGLALVFPIAGVSSVAECVLQRELRFGVIATGELVSYAIGYGVIGVSLALLGFGAWALVAAEISKTIVKATLFLAAAPATRRVGFDAAAFGELVGFGSGYTASGLTTYVASQGDNAVVARVLGATALGYYGRAFELMVVPAQGLGMLLDKVLFPTMSLVQERPELVRLAYRRGTALVALAVMPVAALTIALAPEVMVGLLGPGWEPAAAPLRILAIGARWGIGGVAAGVLVAVVVNYGLVFHLAARLTTLGAGEFLRIHLPAVRIALIIGVEAWLVATTLRQASVPALAILGVSAVVTCLTLFAAIRFVPGVLGAEGDWMLATLCERAPRTLRPVIRVLMPRAA